MNGTHGALENSHREAQINGRGVCSSSSISSHQPSAGHWHPLPAHGSDTTPRSQPPDAISPSNPRRATCQSILHQIRCCISLLGLNHTQIRARKWVANASASFQQAELLHLKYSWTSQCTADTFCIFSRIISAFHLYLATEQGKDDLPQPWLTNHTKKSSVELWAWSETKDNLLGYFITK